MGRYYDCFGNSYMTEKNAIRHALAKGKKAKTYEQMQKVYTEYDKQYPILKSEVCCPNCPKLMERSLGAEYCTLFFNGSLSDEEIFTKHCFPLFLKYLEGEVK